MPIPYENFEIVNEEVQTKLREIGRMMKRSLPEGWGFAHFIYTYGSGGSFFYIASCERDDMIKMLEEFIVKLKEN
jgi:hypothetical protein